VLNQDYPNLELIVADGGSKDDSKAIIGKYANRLHWWCSEPDGGQSDALNKGFSHATGEIMAWLNSDDQHMPRTLYRVAEYFNGNADTDVVYGHRVLINRFNDEIGRCVYPPHFASVLDWADFVPQETLFWRRRLWQKTGGYIDSSFNFALDWELILRFLVKGAKFRRLPFFMGAFRLHSKQKSAQIIDSSGYKEMQRLRKKHVGYYPSKHSIAIMLLLYLLLARGNELLWLGGIIEYE
jgi:glycosyltransferase involved in cell wall biosynthesis